MAGAVSNFTRKSGAPPGAGDPPAPKIKKKLVYKALTDFKTMIGGSLLNFSAGDLISETTLVKQLLDARSPITVEDGTDHVACPVCKHIFPIQTSE